MAITEIITPQGRIFTNSTSADGKLGLADGEHDPNLTITKKTAQYMANLEIHVIKGANHITATSDPLFVSRIKAFIARHDSTTEPE